MLIRKMVFAVVMTTGIAALANDNPVPPNSNGEKWWNQQFILSSFTSVQNGDDIETVIARFAEAGLNALESNTPLEYTAEDLSLENTIRTLKACQKNNIKFFITDHRRMTGVGNPNREALLALVKAYRDYPALGGYYVWDEPLGSHFGAIKKTFSILRGADPSRLPLVAFLPSYGPEKYPTAYPAFARQFVKTVDPPVLSFDYYAMRGTPGAYTQNASVYLDLELWSSLARETGKPLWMYVTSCSWKSSPSLESLRLQVYSAIAYGAKGIQYFVAKCFTGRKPDFAGAPLNMDGSKGEFFEPFKAFNMEIKAVGPYLMPLKLVKVMHTNPAPKGTLPFVSGYLGVMAAPDNLILSFHRGRDGGNYLFIVNKDPNADREIALTVSPGVTLVSLPDKIEQKREKDQVTLSMPKGFGMLLAIKQAAK